MTPAKIVAANWKMNLNKVEALSLASEVLETVRRENLYNVITILAAPYVHLYPCARLLEGIGNFPVSLAAQNCHHEAQGAYTGEVSASMLRSYGVEYVIIGHSERREYARETSPMLLAKLKMALKNGIKPIFCCGEPLAVREAEQQNVFVEQQVREVLTGLTPEEFAQIVLAYEPVWAIGTGKTANATQIAQMHQFLRSILLSIQPQHGLSTSILYGGSCKASNAAEIFSIANVDGGLVGGAALDAREFVNIIAAAQSLA
ncbi:MAG: triose-phosphate isomerase [Cytophagales bacterium]|nr:MAG: triose-phosphate isomerase [Cytophagales bacterium]TAF60711.1 MAG: triose-phosphate isomerase [Cytophagales bacterium]